MAKRKNLSHDHELQSVLESPPRCECPMRVGGRLFAFGERVRSPNERGTHCLWCGLAIGGPDGQA